MNKQDVEKRERDVVKEVTNKGGSFEELAHIKKRFGTLTEKNIDSFEEKAKSTLNQNK